MTLSEFCALLENIDGLRDKLTYWEWSKDTAPALPYGVYFDGDPVPYFADNATYYMFSALFFELYSRHRDFSLEKKIEAEFSSAELRFTKSVVYISEEECWETVYRIEVE